MLTVDPGVGYNYRTLRKLQLGDLGLDIWMCQQSLLDRHDLLSIAIWVHKRSKFYIGLDAIGGQVYDRLVEVML